jgi:prepilin-type N-terminal cleavage/methylation domain-containing protein
MKRFSLRQRAFSLVEILVVLAIMSILMGIGVKTMTGQGSQEFTKGLSEVSGTLELSQTQALSSRATVRVLIGMDADDLVILPLSFAQGGTPTDDESNEMENGKTWTPISKPVVVKNIKLNDEFVPLSDEILLLSDSKTKPVTRKVAGKEITFENMIQFSPSGEATLDNTGKAIRGIQWGIETLGAKSQKAVIRVSGLTGRVQVLREEELAKANSNP